MTLEFKASLPKNNQIVKKIIGFCNQRGGKVIIGIDDNGTILGLSDDEVKYILEHLDQKIVNATSPAIIPHIYPQTIHDKTVVNVEVSSGMNKPYFYTQEGLEKGTYIRFGRTTLRATPEMIKELTWDTQRKSYDTIPIYESTLENLDLEKFSTFLASRKNSNKVDIHIKETLISYELAIEEHTHLYPTVAGILLFGKKPQKFLSEAFIICSSFAGIEGRKTLATLDCTGTVF